MAKTKTIHYILVVDPSQINIQDLITQLPGFKYPEPIRIVRMRPQAFGRLTNPIYVINLMANPEEIKHFNNIEDLRKELEEFHKVRESDLPTSNKNHN